MNKAASVKALLQIKDVTTDDAKLIRKVWKMDSEQLRAMNFPGIRECDIWRWKDRELKRYLVDSILNTCGVEYLGYHKRNHEHVYYCNAGDTYSCTVLFIGSRLVVGCWGDLVERGLIEGAQ